MPLNLTMSGKEYIIRKTGLDHGLNPMSDDDFEKCIDYAEKYYETVRASDGSDIRKIAENTGYSQNKIADIKKYVFKDGHDPDFFIAESWERLIKGDIKFHDKVLLEHELLELELAKAAESGKWKPGAEDFDIHTLASRYFNYSLEGELFYV